jgi:hypothetical protein
LTRLRATVWGYRSITPYAVPVAGAVPAVKTTAVDPVFTVPYPAAPGGVDVRPENGAGTDPVTVAVPATTVKDDPVVGPYAVPTAAAVPGCATTPARGPYADPVTAAAPVVDPALTDAW